MSNCSPSQCFRSVCLIVALALVPSVAEAKEDLRSAESVLRLKTRCYDVGNTETFISKNAIRINFNKDAYLVACSPKWQVVLFNRESKKGISLPCKQWISHSPRWSFSPIDDWIRAERLIEKGTTRVFGRTCTKLVFAHKYPNGRVEVKTGSTQGEVAVDTDRSVPLEACHIFQRVVGAPQLDGLPLSLITHTPRIKKIEGFARHQGGVSHVVSTLEIGRVAAPPGSFVYPKNFQPIKLESEILFDKSTGANVDDFLQTFK